MRPCWLLVPPLALAHGCGSKSDAPPKGEAPAPGNIDKQPAATGTPDQVPSEPPVFPADTRSLELTRTVSVRLKPGEDARRIGTIAIDTRVRWSDTASGKGCKKPWVRIEPRGWVCADYMRPSKLRAMGREVPMLDRNELVPGIYGKITAANQVTYQLEKPGTKKKDPKKKDAKKPSGPVVSTTQVDPALPIGPEGRMVEGPPIVGSMTVRQYGELLIGGKDYWKVSKRDNEYVLRSAISQHKPSQYTGARFGDETGLALPIAFVYPKAYQTAYTLNKPTGGGIARQLPKRTPVSILETHADAQGRALAYRISVPATAPGPGPGSPPITPGSEWIRAGDVRLFTPAAPPALLTPGERWIDVDLDTQILVAFEGETPVFATMVSSGKKETPTTTGIYRMWLKESEADMKNLKSEDPYSVATVPWTQFFFPDEDLAIHTAYWHDAFGQTRSHGCVNLAPKDARWLYFWSEPTVPPGWTMAAGVVEAPGSIVRVRSKADPEPALKGYARQVDEVRRQAG